MSAARRIDLRAKGLARLLIAILVLIMVMASSLAAYMLSRRYADSPTLFGDFDNPDRVNVTAWINRIDTTANVAYVTIFDITPVGALADDSGNFRDDAHMYTTSLTSESVGLAKGQYTPSIEQRFPLAGTVTDYPLDQYTTLLALRIVDANGAQLPTAVSVYNTDEFFRAKTSYAEDNSYGVEIDITADRAIPTVVFAFFVMVLMLGLATAAATAAYYVLKTRRGLLFPACSMMAAILFALIPLRNAVPGNPPIGSLMDFASFFIAEIIISISLISSVLIGYRVQMAAERAENDAPLSPAG